LDQGRQTLAEQGVSARTILESGSPASVLIGSSLRYDVTVIGAESHRNGSMAGLGPVASRIAEHSNASILIGRDAGSDTGVKALVPVDGSDGSLQALDKLGSLVDLNTADVTLVHVVETPWLHTDSDAEWIDGEDESGELEREFTREAEEILENARTKLPARTAVETLIYRGNPADEILGEAERGAYDLVVVASSGSIDLKHQMLGSVSMKVAWNAPCSVLLVRPGGGSL
jgi:nucleotide-binding universal stress UspA family protein